MIQQQVFIAVTSAHTELKERINVAHIASINEFKASRNRIPNIPDERTKAVLRGAFHNNGGLQVKESPDEIMKMIRAAEELVQSKMIDAWVMVEKRAAREAPARRTIQM